MEYLNQHQLLKTILFSKHKIGPSFLNLAVYHGVPHDTILIFRLKVNDFLKRLLR